MTPPPPGARTGRHTRPERSGCSAWLLVGRIGLLNGAAPLCDDDVVVLVSVPTVETSTPSNTIVVRWGELRALESSARTVDGRRRATAPENGSPLFAWMSPGDLLGGLIARVADGAGGAPQSYAPLFYASAAAAGQDFELHVYSQIRLLPEDACFVRITETPLRTRRVEELSWLPTAIGLHAAQAGFLNNHQCYYRKCFQGQELEHKYTLTAAADIWALAADAYRTLRASEPPGFALEYRNEFQAWDYLNHLFEIAAPEEDRGYVSFIPTSDGRHTVKRKWFTEDAFARREQLTCGAAVEGPLNRYVRDVLDVDARQLPSFRRVRYDLNVESVRTGHVCAVLFDRCSLLDDPGVALSQCELEYVRSRTAVPPGEDDVLEEMDALSSWLQGFLEQHGLRSERGHYSKLTFLRDVLARRPDLAGS